jgi:hypothetical protein
MGTISAISSSGGRPNIFIHPANRREGGKHAKAGLNAVCYRAAIDEARAKTHRFPLCCPVNQW